MAILPDLSYARTRSAYVPLNVDAIDNVGANLEAQYKENRTKSDLVIDQLKNMKVRNVNTPILEDARNKAKVAIDALAEKGDYENAGYEVNNIIKSIEADPLLKGAVDDYAKYTAYQAELAKRDKVDGGRRAEAQAYSDATNNKMIEYDPITGYKNQYTGYNPVDTPDINKLVGDLAFKIKESKVPVMVGQNKDGSPVYMARENNGYYRVGEREGISEEEAMGILKAHVQNQPGIQSFLKENLMIDKFQRKFDPTTGANKLYGLEDFGVKDFADAGDFYYMLAKEGHDPKQYQSPEQLEKLHDQLYLDKAASDMASPFAAAVSYTKDTNDFKTNTEWLNNQAFGHALGKIKAQTKANKELEDYKADKEKEKEDRNNYALATSVPAEAINLDVSTQQLDKVNSDIKVAQAKKQDAIDGKLNEFGSPITFSPKENQKLASQLADQRLLQTEANTFVATATQTDEGNKVIAEAYDIYYRQGGDRISLNEFTRRLIDNDIQTPKVTKSVQVIPDWLVQKLGPERVGKGRMETEDIKDVNVYLNLAKNNMKTSKTLIKTVNETLTNEALGLSAWDEGSKSEKSSGVNKAKTVLLKNVMSQTGFGYDVMGAGKQLNEVLGGALDLTETGVGVYKGKPIKVEVIPFTDTQKGVTDNDVMYQFVMRDPVTGKTLHNFKIRPVDQESHSDMLYRLNQDLAAGNSENSVIGKSARIGIIKHEFPQFKTEENRKILDKKVNDRSPAGSIGVGQLVQVGAENYTFVKSKTNIVDHFHEDDPNYSVTLLQEGYHLVRLKDNLPGTVEIDEDNIKNYLYQEGTIYDNAHLNENNISTPNLKKYGAANKDAATAFPSTDEALTNFYKKRKQQK